MNKRDYIAKDLKTPKYKMRVVPAAKLYNRKKENHKLLREFKYA